MLDLAFLSDLPVARRAYAYAATAHVGQTRKDGKPFIEHPVGVAALLHELGFDEETICAALLHDVVEDTVRTDADIREAFGERIAMLVACVTEDPDLPYAERKPAYRARVRRSCSEAQAICAADKVRNAHDLAEVAIGGDTVLISQFRGGLDSQVQRFEAELEMLTEMHADANLCAALSVEIQGLRAAARAAARAACPRGSTVRRPAEAVL